MKKTTGQIIWGIIRGIVLAAIGGFAVLIGSIYCYLGLVPLYMAKVLTCVTGYM